jgi:alpha-glucosidase (family GH31 glycosyl hydrolase)
MEFFIFCSSTNEGNMNYVKKVQHDLATITGFAPLPLLSYLGFHFAKYDWVDADRMIERNYNFTYYDIPVVVFWMDIHWCDQDSVEEGYEYFIFNP